MKKHFVTLALMGMGLLSASATITIQVPQELADDWQLAIYSIDNIAKATSPDQLVSDVKPLVFVDGVCVVENAPYAAQYSIMSEDYEGETFFAAPDEDILVVGVPGTEEGTVNFNASGTALVDGVNQVQHILDPVMERYAELMRAYSEGELASTAELEAIPAQVESLMKEYCATHKDDPSVLYAMMNINDPVDFLECYESLTPAQKSSMLSPIVEQQKAKIEARMAKLMKQENLKNHPAPDFTLPDLAGKQVSLSSLQGKWVIIDFWGSWCGWCIKGMPKLKEAYEQYKGKLEIVGVDCGDTQEAWRAAVQKHGLNWINLYDGQQPRTPSLYGVQGFPTKVIVNPKGEIVDVVTGEDPEFYTKLAELLK